MNQKSFSSEIFPEQLRISSWLAAIDGLGLSADFNQSTDLFYGSLSQRTSPKGLVISRLAFTAQTIGIRTAKTAQPRIVVHLDGSCVLLHSERREALAPGDMIFCPPSCEFDLGFDADARIAIAEIPSVIFDPRLISEVSPRLLRAKSSPSAVMMSRLFLAVAETFESLRAEELRPLDAALREFLSLKLISENLDELERDSQSLLMSRLTVRIDALLDDPQLSAAQVAEHEGISLRYLHRVFESSDENFSQHVRRRRLDRISEDLSDPRLGLQSISQISFRWGFNDAAHFSRSFRERFGVTPREFRQSALTVSSALPKEKHRGWPSKALQDNIDVAFDQGGTSKLEYHRGNSRMLHPIGAHHIVRASSETIHWGFFSRALSPVLEVASGDVITIEALTQHAYDDYDRMIKGDEGAEDVFLWTPGGKNVDRRGAGPMDASVFGRGAGEGFGVHIMTGPIAVKDAEPGDVLEVRILDVRARPSLNPDYEGQCFGSNAAAWWGFHYSDLISEPKDREVITIYEFDLAGENPTARAVYSYRWTPQTDPFGVLHSRIDYPGIPVDPETIEKNFDILAGVEIPVRPHFGVIGVAPREAELVDSIPPSYFGGNLDNWRVGKGCSVYLPISVPGALLSVGDPHASQGDSELGGTAIECSLTGDFQLVLHKKKNMEKQLFADLNYPLVETPGEWILLGFSHPNYLAEFGDVAQSKVYNSASLDLAMRDAFRKMRRFLMSHFALSEDEAVSLISVAVDFGISQVVDGNWAVHAILRKALFPHRV